MNRPLFYRVLLTFAASVALLAIIGSHVSAAEDRLPWHLRPAIVPHHDYPEGVDQASFRDRMLDITVVLDARGNVVNRKEYNKAVNALIETEGWRVSECYEWYQFDNPFDARTRTGPYTLIRLRNQQVKSASYWYIAKEDPVSSGCPLYMQHPSERLGKGWWRE